MENYKFFQRELTPEATLSLLERLRAKGIRAYVDDESGNDSGYVINVHSSDMDVANSILVTKQHQNFKTTPSNITLNNKQIDLTILSHVPKTWKQADLVLDLSYFELGATPDYESRLFFLIDQGIIESQGNRFDLSLCEVRVICKPLKAIGLWNTEKESQYIHPEELVATVPYDDKEKLIAYLDCGEVFQSWLGESLCHFGCGEEELATTDLTDGTWSWPQGLSHYIAVHDVVLPDAFLTHVREKKWQMPYVCLPNDTEDDDTFWISYCEAIRS